MARQPTMEEVRRRIHAKVHRPLDVPIAEIGRIIQRYAITYDEFLVIADVMVQSYDAVKEIHAATLGGSKLH